MRAPRIARLTLTDFRNYGDLRLDTVARLIVLTGPNGAGKTNLLEAISLLAPGRGLRGAAYNDLARHGGSGRWAVAARLDDGVTLGTAWDDTADEPRAVMIDGVRQRSSGALGERLRMAWLTPAMDRLFAGPAGDRRRFLDRLTAIFDPSHASRVLNFEKAMRERNALLDRGGREPAWLNGLEAQMAEAGAAIAATRLAAINALREFIAAERPEGPFPWAAVAVSGDLESAISAKPAVQVEDEYRRLLRDSRGLDASAGRALKGPHRSEFQVTHGPKSMAAELCSTGEQKALLIGLIVAQARAVAAEAGTAPVLLLDEIAAHLDHERRRGLFAELGRLEGQVWMTGTDRRLFEDVADEAGFHHVEAGTISETE